MCVVVGSALLSHIIIFGHTALTPDYHVAIAYGVFIAFVIYPSCSVYRAWRGSSELEEVGTLCFAWSLVFIALLGLAFAFKETSTFSRLWASIWYLTGLFFWITSRLIFRTILRKLRERGFNQKHIAVVGTGRQAVLLAENLQKAPWTGFDIQGFYQLIEPMPVDPRIDQDLLKGELDQLIQNIADKKIDQVWIALPLAESQLIDRTLRQLDCETIDIRLVPDMLNFRLLNHSVSEINGMPILNLSMSPMHGLNRFIKSLEDKLLAFLILLLISPVLVGIAIAVKLSSPGPVIFKQKRHGLDGKEIKIYKFRSMKIHQENGGQVTQATNDDPRVTRLGAFMRRTSVDELPQFFNVLQGRMSIVGPRPHALAHNRYYQEKVESYMRRHKVKPGITGWAQVSGFRGETDTLEKMERRVEYDLYYIQNWSVWFDLKIIVLTVFKGFVNKNAY